MSNTTLTNVLAYRKSARRKELSDMFEPLEEEDFDFIKPFALKWKNQSMFSVLMRYRAIKLQDFFNFSQQVQEKHIHKKYIKLTIFLGPFV